MKKLIVLLALLFSSGVFAAQVDPLWRLHRMPPVPSLNVGDTVDVELWPQLGISPLINVTVKTRDVVRTADRIRACGGKVRNILRGIITASLPERVLESEAALWDEAEYVEVTKQMSVKNDLADSDTQVDIAQAGTGLPYGYDGTGVIIGILDTGIDLTHPAFKSPSGKTRILYLWDQTDPSGPAPTELESSYGTEYTQAQIDLGTVPEKDTQGHGTHVAGTAGGRDASYSGVAPKASFIIVKYSFNSNMSDAVSYIFQKAAALGMPAVVNMSLGSDEGPHDGTTLEEQVLDQLVSEAPGRSVVVAAGNSGADIYSSTVSGGFHASFGVATGDVSRTKFNVFENEAVSAADIWGEQECAIDLSIDLWNAGGVVATTGWVANGAAYTEFQLADRAMVAIDRTETVNAQNGKWHSYFTVTPSATYSSDDDYLSLNIQGSCRSFDVWSIDSTLFIYDKSGDGWFSGDNRSTVSLPSTAANMMAIGAYTTRNSWIDSSGQTQDYPSLPVNELSYFSSRGPGLAQATQGVKPNIAAPGAFLISSRSVDSTPSTESIIDDLHVTMAGTSMATPHTVGIVALMLQAYPLLTYAEIMDYLQSTAKSDGYVGAVPNDDWGYGKVDAFAAVSAVVADHPPVDETAITFPRITAGSTNADYETEKILVNFPRAVDATTINLNNVYVNVLATGDTLSRSSAWAPSSCDSNGETISSAVTLTDPQTLEITLSETIGLGDFAICLSPDVRDRDGATFWGKTVQFGTSLPNTGCSLVRAAYER